MPVRAIAPVRRSERTAQRPRLKRGLAINEYRHEELVALARWIRSDTLLRTDEQMLVEMMSLLGFNRRGGRIVAALGKAIDDAH